MEARDAGFQAEVLMEVAAHALGEELLPAITVLRHGRVRVFLFQRNHFVLFLLIAVVNAGRRGVKEAFYAAIARGHQQCGCW